MNGGVFVMISLCRLHSCVCSVRCGMVRLGQTYILSYVCGVFLCGKEFVVMGLCLMICDYFVMRRRLCSYKTLSRFRDTF